MYIEKCETSIRDCYELKPRVLSDQRGYFVKTYHQAWFEELGLRNDWVEQYYTVSKRGVLRGLHFQLPPHDHAKLVYCCAGEVLDVAVDLRKGSPSYGQYHCLTLSADKGNMIYLSEGIAHGFYTMSMSATIVYNVTSIYVPTHDTGIHWDSVGIPWPDSEPNISARDSVFSPLNGFNSPFIFYPTTD